MDREQMIQNLVAECFHQIVEHRRSSWLLRALENGFAGYAHLDDGELAREAACLGIGTADLLEANPEIEEQDDCRAELACLPLPRQTYGESAYSSD